MLIELKIFLSNTETKEWQKANGEDERPPLDMYDIVPCLVRIENIACVYRDALDERASIIDVVGSSNIIVPMKYEDLKKFILSKM